MNDHLRIIGKRVADGQTELSSLDRVCIACSAVKTLDRNIADQ